MRVLFIYPIPPGDTLKYHFGIGYLSAVIKQKAHKTRLLAVSDSDHDYEKIREEIKRFKPGLIAFSTTTDQFKASKSLISQISKDFNVPIIMGGVHPTVAAEESIRIKGLLGICRGEGEHALLELVETLEKGRDYTKIRNLWFKTDKGIIKNPLRPLIDDLDSLPYPDREIFDYQKIIDTVKNRAIFLAGRGCPFQCTYCINRVLKGIYNDKGGYLRQRSVDGIIAEIKKVLSQYKNIKLVAFHDDTFTLNRKWLKEFCEKYKREIGIQFNINARVNTLNKEIIAMLKDAGCSQLQMGIESGNEHIRNNVLKRGISEQQIINAFRLAKKYGMKTYSFNMVGLPFETEQAIKDTIRLNRKLQPDVIQVSVFEPYPGTKLHDLCKSRGWISSRKIESYFEGTSVLDLPTISAEKIKFYYKLFHPLVYNSWLSIFFLSFMERISFKDKTMYDIYKDKKRKLISAVSKRIPEQHKVILRRALGIKTAY